MNKWIHRRRVVAIFALGQFLRGLAAHGENAASNFVAKLEPVAPCAALVAAAQISRIPLEGIDARRVEDRLDPGDTVTALITFFQAGSVRRQWLVHLEAVAAKEDEQTQKQPRPQVFYSSAGTKLEFGSSPAFVVVRTLGPFVESSKTIKSGKPEEKTARFPLNKGFLGLGLNHAAAALHTLKRAKAEGKIWVRNAPFNEAEIAEGKKVAVALGLTAEQDRALMGGIPAMQSYFEIVQHTPGLSDILFEILDLPSAWSMIRNRGIKEVEFQFERKRVEEAAGDSWGVGEFGPAYYLPMVLKLNKEPALNLAFVVTSPNPPLLACAGVVGLLAEKPGKGQTYLTLRIISARRAAKN